MSDIFYTKDHEWVRIEESNNSAYVGISDYAQEQLGELVFIELPEVESTLGSGDEVAVIESVKAAGEVKNPLRGTITAVNDALNDNPGLINESPTTDGWIYQIELSDASELENLMGEDAYEAYLQTIES